jgi:hypothetical protein
LAMAQPSPRSLSVYAPFLCCDSAECADVPLTITPVSIKTK